MSVHREDALIAACGERAIAAMVALAPMLVRSSALSPSVAANALGCAESEIDGVLAGFSFRVERDEQGWIVGAGVTSIPTQHRFRVGEHARYVWCALDALLFPVVLRSRAEVESSCAVTGEPVRFTATPEGVEGLSPPDAHVVVVPPAVCCSDLRTAFCDEVVFAKDEASAARHVRDRSGAWAMPVASASVLARSMAVAAMEKRGGCA